MWRLTFFAGAFERDGRLAIKRLGWVLVLFAQSDGVDDDEAWLQEKRPGVYEQAVKLGLCREWIDDPEEDSKYPWVFSTGLHAIGSD